MDHQDPWLLNAEAKLYELEAEGEAVRAQFKMIDDERLDIGSQINLQEKELTRFHQTGRLLQSQKFAGIQDAVDRNNRSIANCEARISALNSRMASANSRHTKLSNESRPLIRLLEGCRKAMQACTPVNI